MESMIDPCYGRGPIISPFLLNNEETASLFLRERALFMGHPNSPNSGSGNMPPGIRGPVMWRPHPGFPTINPTDFYNLLTTCPPWYSAAIGAHLRSPNPTSGSSPTSAAAAAAFAFTSPPHFWNTNTNQIPSELAKQSLINNGNMMNGNSNNNNNSGVGPTRPSHPHDPSIHRFTPYPLYSPSKKDLNGCKSSSTGPLTSGLLPSLGHHPHLPGSSPSSSPLLSSSSSSSSSSNHHPLNLLNPSNGTNLSSDLHSHHSHHLHNSRSSFNSVNGDKRSPINGSNNSKHKTKNHQNGSNSERNKNQLNLSKNGHLNSNLEKRSIDCIVKNELSEPIR